MVTSIRRIFFLLLLLAACTISVEAQTTGTIIGRVVDSTGAPVIGATVRVETTARGGYSKAPDGKFVIAGIRAGTYTLTVRTVGYSPVQLTATVNVDSTVNVGVVRLQALPIKEWPGPPRRPGNPDMIGSIRQSLPIGGIHHIPRASMLRRGAVGTMRIISGDDLW